MANELWIFADQGIEHIAPVTGQLITKAKTIAKDRPVVAVLFENPDQNLEEEVLAYNPDKIMVAKNERFRNADDTVIASALAGIVREHQPNALLFGATPLGRSIAPRVQAQLETGLTADCLDLFYENDLLIQVKPSYGDNVMCEIICPDRRPQMASVRPNTFAAEKVDNPTTDIEQLQLSVPEQDVSIEVLKQNLKVANTAGITAAGKIMALGRGAEDDSLIDETRKIAGKLGAAVGVSRPLTDRPDFSVEQQIGQSGVTVAPDLLINLGISGAVQYLVGISQAKLIISVNKDESAPILTQSDYVYVGETGDFIKALGEKVL